MSAEAIEIREAVASDLPGIVAIYNDAIVNTTATFDSQPKTVEEQRDWFTSHSGRHPILVAEARQNGKGQDRESSTILGWGSVSPWSDRCAYHATAEVSYYVADAALGGCCCRA